MRCIVAGAAGFIGSHLVEQLSGGGHEVVGVDNLVTGQPRLRELLSEISNFNYLDHDITLPLDIDGPVEVIYNLACPASPVDFGMLAEEILRVCSAGTWNLLELARRKNAVFVHASTSECYGDPVEHPQKESYWGNVNPVGARCAYDEGKRFAEALVMTAHRRHGARTRIARIFNTYGPRMRVGDGRVLPNFIQQALEHRPLTVYGDGSQTRSFCYVTDLVQALVQLSGVDDPMPVNLGNPDEIRIMDLATEVIALSDSRSTIAQRPLPEDDPKIRRPDIDRARKILNWEPSTKRQDGLRRTIDYFRTVLISEKNRDVHGF